jgi:hypothetical protein
MKWKLNDLKQYLKDKLEVDENTIFRRIEDLVIKTILGAEPALHNGVAMFVPGRDNCFELLGFDILLDE